MDLKKLPPSMLLALGLMSCDDPGSTTSGDTSTTGPCLSPAEETMGPCLDVGPCLSPEPPTTTGSTGGTSSSSGTTEGEVSTGPCLTPEPPDSSGSDTSGSDSDSGTDGTSSGGMEAPPADSRAAALQRVLDRGALPADVAARLSATEED